jgi:predicted extracellular nuclease
VSRPTRAPRRPMTLALIAALAMALLPATGARPALAASTDLFFSEYIEGTSNNKALEIYNGTGASVDLGSYVLRQYSNGSATAGLIVTLSGTLAPGDVFVFAHASANASIIAQADRTTTSGLFNGNDAVALWKGTSLVDVIGQIGFDPGTEWGSGLTSTADNTLRRKASVIAGDTNGGDAFDPSVEWDGYATDTFDGLGSHTTDDSDAAPAATSSSPADGATSVAADATISVTFSEAVTLDAGALTIDCVDGEFVATSDPAVFELDYTPPLPDGATCTITVEADLVHDVDTDDPPDTLVADVIIDFTVVAADACAAAYTEIGEIQGSGTTSPYAGQTGVTTQGLVTGVFPGLRGFTLLDTDGDDDAATSDGVFVFRGPAFATDTPEPGDVLRVTGRVGEFQNHTQVDLLSEIVECGTAEVPDPVVVTLPETVNGELERYEGQVVTIDQTLTAQQNFFQGRFGQVTLALGGRLDTPTDQYPAGSAEAIALADQNQRRLIVLDDGSTGQNPNPIPYIGADDTLRAGDTIPGVTGLLDEGAINSNTAIRDYRIHPTGSVTFTRVNDRPATPEDVGGWLKVASFNVLNYFNGDGLGGGFPTERGANTALEFERQRAKIIAAIVALDADVVGLMEIENDGSGPTSAIADLVDGLNEATAPGTWDWIDDPATDVAKPDEPIKTALIYRPGVVEPVGVSLSDTDPSFERYPVAQTFRLIDNGEVVTVLVNHFKSKGSCDEATDPADLDQGDGQGCFNATRVAEAEALLGFIAELQADTGDDDVLVTGDLNAYAQEDPILALLDGGLVDLLALHEDNAYTYVFDGQAGVLDHALATASLVHQITGADAWHINADEPSVIDYNTEFKPQDLYQPDLYRASDHDPVLVGIDLGRCAFEDDGTTRTLLGDCSTDETVLVPDAWTLDGDGHTISAFDRSGSPFLGAVVANAGAIAHVVDLGVTAYELADVCHAGDDRLRGILLDGAAGSVQGARVSGVDQGSSGCQEGNGIEVRNEPFDTTGPDVSVTVQGNTVTDYQKTGIAMNGSVVVSGVDNVVTGWGPTGVIAQNGIQVGFGATAFLRGNSVSGNSYTGPDVACGLLFFEADGVRQQANTLVANERDVCNFGRGGGAVEPAG